MHPTIARSGAVCVAALFGTLRQYQHALAATLGGQFQLDVDYARARGYDTALEAYMDKDDIDTKVYDNLVSTINANLPLLHRYVELRKKALGLDDIHLYDLYIPIVEGVAVEVPFADARTHILAGLAPLGAEYGAALAEGLDPANGWIDLYPHRDKAQRRFLGQRLRSPSLRVHELPGLARRHVDSGARVRPRAALATWP